jgi:hypothetical protein
LHRAAINGANTRAGNISTIAAFIQDVIR